MSLLFGLLLNKARLVKASKEKRILKQKKTPCCERTPSQFGINFEGFCSVRKAQWMVLIFFYKRNYSPKDVFPLALIPVYLLQVNQQTTVPHSFQAPHPIPFLT